MKPPTVKVQLGNRWAVFDCDPDVQVRLKRWFSYEVPGGTFSEAFRCGSWDGRANMMARGRVAASLFVRRWKELDKKFQLIVTDERKRPEFKTLPYGELRPYQITGLEKMIAASNCGGIVLVGTGAGKTRMAGALFARLVGNGMFICDELALLEQSRKALEAEIGEEIGVVGRSEFKPRRITVATSQTLHRHRDQGKFKKWFKKIDVVITDEAHVEVNERSVEIIQRMLPLASFGLTATLELSKPHVRLPAIALYGPVVFRYPINEGVKDGYLSDGVICQVGFHDPLMGVAPAYPTLVDGKKVWIEAGSQAAEYRRRVCLNRSRNDCIEGIVREGLRRGRKIVVLVDWKIHLKMLDTRFTDVKHRSLSGAVKSIIRLEAMREMDAGELNLILASKVFAKGVDISEVSMIVDATGLPSRNNALQRYGRGARKAKSRDLLWYVDIADIGNRFSGAGHARLKALKEIGAPIVSVKWCGNPEEILNKIEGVSCEKLKRCI